ncbi:MAG: DUF4918 family protein [Ferruginibacter sp.]|nr:DUF4918 family protein [Cytophagales bacterium]
MNQPSPPASGTTFAERAIAHFLNFRVPDALPGSAGVINPYQSELTRELVRQFYTKFFDDTGRRILVLGINPGRFGGGTTGIAFTDPVALRQYCGISNALSGKSEMSSRFVYALIQQFGGAAAFFARFHLGALYPLALVKNGKNYNYYDDPALYQALKPAIVENLRAQVAFGADERYAICLGRKNGDYLQRLNEEHSFFRSIVALDHPRYIMQYKSAQASAYVERYLAALRVGLGEG